MQITKTYTNNELTILIEGRLDTLTAPTLEQELLGENPEKLTLDLSKLDYISSAGLRIVLKLRKQLKENLVIKNANELVRDVFELTGFASILIIE